jgi:hypothetical protein
MRQDSVVEYLGTAEESSENYRTKKENNAERQLAREMSPLITGGAVS